MTRGDKTFFEIDGELFPALEPLGPPPIPKDNPQRVDAEGWPLEDDPKVKLGKLLFFEPALSGDGSVSCQTCHVQGAGWALNSAISRSYPGQSHWRNSQSVVNAAYMSKLFWDGHTASLETQAPSAAKGLAGNGKHDMMSARLTVIPEYVEMFTEAFGSIRNPMKDSWRAISAYERTLTSTDSPIDQYLRGDKDALDESQVRGMDLFNGKARCIMCHNGKLASDEKFYNLGLPRQPLFSEIAKNQIGFRSQNYGAGLPEEMFRKTKSDLGLYHRTHNHEDAGLFRTQPLRFIEYTPPYYHNGVMDDLFEVVEFYNDGGGEDYILEDMGFSTKTDRLRKLNLTSDEMDDLVAFLEGFSGTEILTSVPELPKPPVRVSIK
ncbi:MAG: cytochrome-c peroxidase [bacterium]|nr:cytochrome-c peroxidase [bacterium]